ncbi:MAG: hypothetical protein ACD_36C00122G0001 [uncultured bacterium]|nr:MAG: hypothetical protein ACD_36C00122G0001 [uncultured bacterium]
MKPAIGSHIIFSFFRNIFNRASTEEIAASGAMSVHTGDHSGARTQILVKRFWYQPVKSAVILLPILGTRLALR